MYFLTSDHLGGTGLVSKSNGDVQTRVRYYPYGGIRTEEGSTLPTDKLFTGHQADTIVPCAERPSAYNRSW
jgi:hypothetical protein